MFKLPPELLGRPVSEAARVVAGELLAQAGQAYARLPGAGDPSALHDFRVAMRRLDTWLEAYRVVLGPAGRKKVRHRLRALTRESGRARDIEVQLAWLRDEASALAPEAQARLDPVVRRLTRAHRKASDSFQKRAHEDFPKRRDDLARRLSSAERDRHHNDVRPGDTFRATTAELVEKQAEQLMRGLDPRHLAQDASRAHCARILGKRVRYLLEPLERLAGCRELTGRAKELQDLLGGLHDAQVFSQRFQELERKKHFPKSARPVLAEVERLLERRANELIARLSREWLTGGAVRYRDDLRRFCDRLAGAASLARLQRASATSDESSPRSASMVRSATKAKRVGPPPRALPERGPLLRKGGVTLRHVTLRHGPGGAS